jgi:outer membrane protein assembly factor BamB
MSHSDDRAAGRAGQPKLRLVGAVAALAVLAGCADREVILPGERVPVRPEITEGAFLSGESFFSEPEVSSDEVLGLPDPVQVTEWTHRAGSPTHEAPHAALRAQPAVAWSADIGAGNSRKHRITGQPVVAGGRIFVLDSQSRVSAVSTEGATLWARDLTPAGERTQDASGGGVAVSGDRVMVTTGFGEVVALDAASGAELWRQNLDAPATAAPTVVGGIVYAVARDNRAWALDAETGRVRWQLPGTPDVSGVIGGASPAVTERVAIFPFGSGELVAVLRQGGVRLWGSQVSGKRRGKAYANITDITADPVVVGDVIYTGNQSGRAVALSLNSGTRIWTAREGAFGPVAVGGNGVFMLSDQAELVRLNADTGVKVWGTDLPFLRNEKARRAKAIFAHYGPVLAGGALWVASDNGTLRSYDPANGAPLASIELPGGAASTIAVANGTMYVITGRGQLVALR